MSQPMALVAYHGIRLYISNHPHPPMHTHMYVGTHTYTLTIWLRGDFVMSPILIGRVLVPGASHHSTESPLWHFLLHVQGFNAARVQVLKLPWVCSIVTHLC